MSLAQIAKKTPYSPKYLNLMIGKGLLQAQKEGRNWYTTLDAVKNYEQTRLRIRKV